RDQGPEGMDRSSGPPMRLLPVWHDHVGNRPDRPQPASDGRGSRSGRHEYLPLQHLSADTRSGPFARRGRVNLMGTTRRVVLGVAGGAGALLVGYALWPSHRLDRDDAVDAAKGERFLQNWIKIDSDDTVTVVIPHCDMGTGIFTSLAQLAADELDV